MIDERGIRMNPICDVRVAYSSNAANGTVSTWSNLVDQWGHRASWGMRKTWR